MAAEQMQAGMPERYEVRRHIATGGMASVWCAYDAALGRQVAIKVLAAQFAREDGAVRRFKREAQTAARLSAHPHVVTIYDVGEAEGRPYIVMEHLAGGTVADALRVGPVEPEQALRWLREASSALDYAHGRGVVHRDIKPGNLLLSNERVLRVGDFGIARLGAEDTLTGNGELFGTAAYLSPEQARGRQATDASDRYALAVAAFELLTGQRPFAAEHFAAQARQHIEEDPPAASRRNRALPRAVDAVLARGMAKRPEQRWPTAGAFAEALEESLTSAGSTRAFDALARSRGRIRAARPSAVLTGSAHAPGSATAPEPPPIFTSISQPAPRRPSRAAAIAALGAAALAIGVVAGAGRSGGTGAGNTGGTAAPSQAVRHAQPARLPTVVAHAATHHGKPIPPPPPAATTTAVAGTPPTADTLEARGHQLMVDGAYSEAIAMLRQAIDAAPPGDLTYAYALYDLGRSLRLSGDPQAAVAVLEQRLQIPNQSGVVLSELQLARREAGITAPASGRGGSPAQTGSPHDGGAGLAPPSPPGHRHRHQGKPHPRAFSTQAQTD